MVPAPFIVVVDANVLFPLTLRDTVLRAAAADLYQLRWSKQILDEMERNLVATGTMPADKAARLREQMEKFLPEAMVTGYEPLVAVMQNDAKDRHVVAAAVKAGAQVITTANLKDFTPLPDGIEAQSPDEFLCNLFDLHPEGFIELLREQASDLHKPPVTFGDRLRRERRSSRSLRIEFEPCRAAHWTVGGSNGSIGTSGVSQTDGLHLAPGRSGSAQNSGSRSAPPRPPVAPRLRGRRINASVDRPRQLVGSTRQCTRASAT